MVRFLSRYNSRTVAIGPGRELTKMDRCHRIDGPLDRWTPFSVRDIVGRLGLGFRGSVWSGE